MDFQKGARIEVKPECVGEGGRNAARDGGRGTIKRPNVSFDWAVELDSGTWWGYDEHELILLEDTMERYTDEKGQTWEQLRPVTIKALSKWYHEATDRERPYIEGAIDAAINAGYFYYEGIPLEKVIDYASDCYEQLDALVAQGFVKKVEEYEVKLGDTYLIGKKRYKLHNVESGVKIQLLCEDGRGWFDSVRVDDVTTLSMEDFKKILTSSCDWKEIYATRVPYKQ